MFMSTKDPPGTASKALPSTSCTSQFDTFQSHHAIARGVLGLAPKDVNTLPPPTSVTPTLSSMIPPSNEASSISDDQSEDRKNDIEVNFTDGERLEERRAKNRLSAHQSRLRKRRQLKYLQNQVLMLSDENKKLASSNQNLISQLATTRTENNNLRLVQQDTMRIATALRLAQTGLQPGLNGGSSNAPNTFPPF